jgi:hypothetical protein
VSIRRPFYVGDVTNMHKIKAITFATADALCFLYLIFYLLSTFIGERSTMGASLVFSAFVVKYGSKYLTVDVFEQLFSAVISFAKKGSNKQEDDR